MQNIVDSIVQRIEEYMTACATLTEPYVADTDPAYITVDPDEARFFDICWAYKQPPQAIIFEPGSNDPSNIYNVNIKDVDRVTGVITLVEPLDVDIPDGWFIKRAPNWTVVQNVILGDPTSIETYPTICIVPKELGSEWMTLNSTSDTANVDILVYVLEDNLPNSERSRMRIATDLQDLLNADLKLKINRPTDGHNRLYYSYASKISFGSIEKGTNYLKAAMMNWTGNEAWIRFLNARQRDLTPFQ